MSLLVTTTGCSIKQPKELEKLETEIVLEEEINELKATDNQMDITAFAEKHNIDREKLEQCLKDFAILNNELYLNDADTYKLKENYEILNDYINVDGTIDFDIYYTSLIFKDLKDNNLGISFYAYLDQLENLYNENKIPRCMDEEEWDYNFGYLNQTYNEQEISLVELYLIPAKVMHEVYENIKQNKDVKLVLSN